ncbi:hypothetical protein BKA65DRAFT_23053 [Rhexocercosporidium sp. MPI-PUGE-AT-0058]|nr:hypothetical protein BKA65DRAFT_23053 [Rhexocercosporidium sp. MPI-PUGE-AT-0058]
MWSCLVLLLHTHHHTYFLASGGKVGLLLFSGLNFEVMSDDNLSSSNLVRLGIYLVIQPCPGNATLRQTSLQSLLDLFFPYSHTHKDEHTRKINQKSCHFFALPSRIQGRYLKSEVGHCKSVLSYQRIQYSALPRSDTLLRWSPLVTPIRSLDQKVSSMPGT